MKLISETDAVSIASPFSGWVQKQKPSLVSKIQFMDMLQTSDLREAGFNVERPQVS